MNFRIESLTVVKSRLDGTQSIERLRDASGM